MNEAVTLGEPPPPHSNLTLQSGVPARNHLSKQDSTSLMNYKKNLAAICPSNYGINEAVGQTGSQIMNLKWQSWGLFLSTQDWKVGNSQLILTPSEISKNFSSWQNENLLNLLLTKMGMKNCRQSDMQQLVKPYYNLTSLLSFSLSLSLKSKVPVLGCSLNSADEASLAP